MTDQPQLFAKLVVLDADRAIAYYESDLGAVRLQRHTLRERVFAPVHVLGTHGSSQSRTSPTPPTTLGRPGVLLSVTTEDPDRDRLAAAMVGGGGETARPAHDGA